MNTHPGAIIQVTGGGSGTGIAALINGTTDICQASRPMKEDEKRKLRDRYQSMGVETAVAKDGLSVYLNEQNPLKELTIEQLRNIYTGTFTNWKQVGGADARIGSTGARTAPGRTYFKDNVLPAATTRRHVRLPGTRPGERGGADERHRLRWCPPTRRGVKGLRGQRTLRAPPYCRAHGQGRHLSISRDLASTRAPNRPATQSSSGLVLEQRRAS